MPKLTPRCPSGCADDFAIATAVAADPRRDRQRHRAGRRLRDHRQIHQPVLHFSYTRGYLALPTGYDLDPALRRDRSTHIRDGIFGAFADCSPDWWGRNLITRRLRAQAREAGQPPPLITDIDFLTGVSDTTRQGALRFRRPGAGSYLAADIDVPKLIALPTLLQASDEIAGDTSGDDGQQAVETLLDAGSGTLGGARPKASVRDGDTLYIAKFPHPRDDQWDVMAWEKTALDLAELAGLAVPARRLESVGDRNVLLVERFDRRPRPDGGLDRIGYVSASTLVGGERSVPRDYLDISAAIEDYSAAAADDLIDSGAGWPSRLPFTTPTTTWATTASYAPLAAGGSRRCSTSTRTPNLQCHARPRSMAPPCARTS